MSRVMRQVWDAAAAATQSVLAHGFRSALTTLGIIIGIGAVISVVSVMDALGRSVGDRLKELGTEMVTLKAYTSTDMEMLGVTNRLVYEDYLAIKGRVPGVQAIAARMTPYSLDSRARFRKNTSRTQIIGTESGYQQVVNVFPQRGRYLRRTDDIRRRRVAVLGDSVVDELGLPEDPVGQYIQIREEWFKVVGVAEPRGSIFGIDQDNYILAPLSTVRAVLDSEQADDIQIVFRPSDPERLEQVIDGMREVLRSKYRLTEGDPDFFEFETSKQARARFSEIKNSITMVAAGVVGISLIVGGIGIMNIMLVSVTERTREIGLSKALGATSGRVMLQFLVEACILALFGGILGILLGYLVTAMAGAVLPIGTGMQVPAWSVWLAMAFSAFIGVVFGVAPAVKASRLDPIDALRYE
jgi:putative ABC transport system permease protein